MKFKITRYNNGEVLDEFYLDKINYENHGCKFITNPGIKFNVLWLKSDKTMFRVEILPNDFIVPKNSDWDRYDLG